MSQPDPIGALAEADPKKVGNEEFVELLAAASEHAKQGTADLSALRPEQFAKLISRASAAQVEAVMARPELRVQVLDEVFRRMGEHYKAEKARSTEAVVRWRIGTEDADTVRYETVLTGGTCTVNKEPQHDDPRVTIMITPVEFLKLVSGNASAPVQFMTGKLKVAGDVGFAAGLTKLFQIPKA
ncbi:MULTISPECIES: SCP2 sterol-binding domain-containing protein [unclassified Saccharopolyspora]|uniref:SCP2 sterol-binding domain-containing protein n=1 Tax=Saccharopolyspora TaxID=1835 RepID=UPI001F425906|nr:MULTISPECIES: SCP2 sterol-binding domain-containing protein [unclassified Saccharopolyspora]MBK0865235.1 SCP2 sterol-binding domain-containing protein [Saccharopolyspora sp. HNM0986]